jgi:hypothetical protein
MAKKKKKKEYVYMYLAGHWWLMFVTLATGRLRSGGLQLEASQGKSS